jgi:hypothetical protein
MLVITLFAELGTDGEYIGRAVADRLGLAFVDRGILSRAVEEALSQTPTVPDHHLAWGRWVRQIAQRTLVLARSNREAAGSHELPAVVMAGGMSEEQYLRLLQTVLLDLSRAGRVLLMGRGAEALLRDPPTSLHVRLVAPLERRVMRVMELLHADRALALEAIERADSIHSGYLKYAMNVDWTDPSLYDLTINTARFPTDQAVELVTVSAAVLGYRRRARRPATREPAAAEAATAATDPELDTADEPEPISTVA